MTGEPIKGRGARANPRNRFETLEYERDPEWTGEDDPAPRTRFYRDASKSILSHNDSPDIPFETGLNPYRGCEHGCAYCYARPTHEYLGWSAGLDFETRILVKEDAPALLRNALMNPRYTPRPIAMSGVTDCYQPVERRLKLTRRCLEVLAEFRNPVMIITKNALVARDMDVLADLAAHDCASVMLSIPTLDVPLNRALEPRTSLPRQRLDAIRTLAEADVPVGVLTAPVIPGLTDSEVPGILKAAAKAGATFAGFEILRLPFGVKDLFAQWLDDHMPDRKDKVLNRIRAMRGGKLNDPAFGSRMRGHGPFAEQVAQLFHAACRQHGLNAKRSELSTAAFRRPGQLELF